MLSHALNALARKRSTLDEKEKGFTLIELLVVVIIIGILAAIAIPVYLGVQNSSKDAGVKSDLTNAKTAVIAYQTDTGAFPVAASLTKVALSKYGFTVGSDTGTIAYSGPAPTATSTTFCLAVPAASDGAKKFYVTDSTGVTQNATATRPAGC